MHKLTWCYTSHSESGCFSTRIQEDDVVIVISRVQCDIGRLNNEPMSQYDTNNPYKHGNHQDCLDSMWKDEFPWVKYASLS